jgi:hypothetical protein
MHFCIHQKSMNINIIFFFIAANQFKYCSLVQFRKKKFFLFSFEFLIKKQNF